MSTCVSTSSFFFFFNDTATTEIYTLSLHDALPISMPLASKSKRSTGMFSGNLISAGAAPARACRLRLKAAAAARSEEHTSELQSRLHLVCRLLLEKKKKQVRRPQRAITGGAKSLTA